MKKIRILELTHFSSGICGVWERVKQESLELSKKHNVKIFSSNSIKGTDKIAKNEDSINGIEIKRFPFTKLGGESFMTWNFKKEALNFKPDIIIAHSYRQPHTTKALKIKKILQKKGLNCKVFLVTHAPFIKGNSTRSFLGKFAVIFYDKFIGTRLINKFDKIIAITKWEIPYLLKLGIDKKKIEYVPNGIPKEFFETEPKKGENILFFGRIAMIKNLETLIKAARLTKEKIKIIGFAEKNYLNKLKNLVKELNIKNVEFLPPVFGISNKIKAIDSAEIFILPSLSEAMPQSLIEAMARKKIVIASNNNGSKDLIKNNENGFLFEIGNSKELADIINKISKMKKSQKDKIKKNAYEYVSQFSWTKIIKKLEELI